MLAALRSVFRPDPHAWLRDHVGARPLPPFPHSIQRVLKALRDPERSMAEVGRQLASDASLTVDVLRQVNAPAYGLRRPVADAAHAARLLGRTELEALVLGRAVQRTLPRPPGFDADAFWRIAARRAHFAASLANLVQPAQVRRTYTAALLQDLAVPLLADVNPQAYREVLQAHARGGGPLSAHERSLDHAEVGGVLCRAWHFPPELTDAIAGHHGPDAPAPLAVAALWEHAQPEVDRLVAAAETHLGLPAEPVRALVTAAQAS